MTDYCVTCNHIASGRCARDNAFICETHKRQYPVAFAHIFEQAGQERVAVSRVSGAPLTFSGWVDSTNLLFCPDCYEHVVEEALPHVAAHLSTLNKGSSERAVLHLLKIGGWLDTFSGYTLLGPRVITALTGRRPGWLFDGSIQTLAALYACLSPSVPPRIDIVFEHERRTNPFFGTPKTKTTREPLGSFNAWSFPYRDDFDWVLFVGASGSVLRMEAKWRPRSGSVIALKETADRAHLPWVREQIASHPQSQAVFHGDAYSESPLVSALKEILP